MLKFSSKLFVTDSDKLTDNPVHELVYKAHKKGLSVNMFQFKIHPTVNISACSRQGDPRWVHTLKTEPRTRLQINRSCSNQSPNSNTTSWKCLLSHATQPVSQDAAFKPRQLNTASCSWYAWNSPQLKKTPAGNKQPRFSSQSAQLLPSVHSIGLKQRRGSQGLIWLPCR